MSKRTLHRSLTIFLIFGITLTLSRAASARGAGETFETEVKGYHVSLSFISGIKTGENEVHVQIADSEDQFVTPAEVVISVMASEEEGHEAAGEHGAEPAAEHGTDTDATSTHAQPASGHENMAAISEAMTEGTHNMEAGTYKKSAMVILEPEMGSGEYKGILHFEQSGQWNLAVHFVIGEELLEVEFPINVAGRISKNSILTGILGLNVTIVSTAAVLKRQTAKKSK